MSSLEQPLIDLQSNGVDPVHSAPKDAMAIAEGAGEGGHVLTVVAKRMRAAKKKLTRIEGIEKTRQEGKAVNADQEELLKAKSGLKFQFEELEKLTPLLKDAVAEERKSAGELALAEREAQQEASAAPAAQSEEEPLLKADPATAADLTKGRADTVSEEEVAHLLQLIYFAKLFGASPSAAQERAAAAGFDFTAPEGEPTAEEDLQAIASFGLSIVQQPKGSSISHKDWLDSSKQKALDFVHHAHTALGSQATTDLGLQPRIGPICLSATADSVIMFARHAPAGVNRLAERLQRIVSSDFFASQPVSEALGLGTAQASSATSQQDLLSEITTPNPLVEHGKPPRPQPNGFPSATSSQSGLQQGGYQQDLLGQGTSDQHMSSYAHQEPLGISSSAPFLMPQDQSSFTTHMPSHTQSHAGFPEPMSSHNYQPLAQSESQSLPAQQAPQASLPSNEPSFFPSNVGSMSSQGPSHHPMGLRGLDSTSADGFSTLHGLMSSSQPGGAPPMSAAQVYGLGPDPSSIPPPAFNFGTAGSLSTKQPSDEIISIHRTNSPDVPLSSLSGPTPAHLEPSGASADGLAGQGSAQNRGRGPGRGRGSGGRPGGRAPGGRGRGDGFPSRGGRSGPRGRGDRGRGRAPAGPAGRTSAPTPEWA